MFSSRTHIERRPLKLSSKMQRFFQQIVEAGVCSNQYAEAETLLSLKQLRK